MIFRGHILEAGTGIRQNFPSSQQVASCLTESGSHRFELCLKYLIKTPLSTKTPIFHFSAFTFHFFFLFYIYRSCRVLTYSANLLYHCCDAQRGSSGAGVYEIHRPKKGKYLRYVVGVFSGNRDKITRRPPQFTCSGHSRRIWFTRFYSTNYNAALRFKEQDVYHICTWMRRLGGENCKKFLKERRRKRRQSARKRRERSKEAYARCQSML